MYARKNGEQELTFFVSGMLWQRSLVMQDKETGSLWSHLLGKSMRGKLEGTQLETIPALLTDWQTWLKSHPNTTVLAMSRTTEMFTSKAFRNFRPFVVGMSRGDQAKAWGWDDLQKHSPVNDTFAGQPVVIEFDAESATPYIRDRRVDQQILTFIRKGDEIIDEQSKSTWDLQAGVCTAGDLQDRKLELLVGISSFRKAWNNFYPKSEFWKPEKRANQ